MGSTLQACFVFLSYSFPFGKGAEDITKKYGIPHFDSMPIDSKLAALCDAGDIESYEGRYLDLISQAIHALKGKE